MDRNDEVKAEGMKRGEREGAEDDGERARRLV
jgi:hypothetical protein